LSVLNAGDFNVIGDGQQHNTLELMALRDHIRAGPDRIWRVEFEPGHYCYLDNRWLMFGDRTVILDFNNSKVECFADAILPLGAGPISWVAEYPATPTAANRTTPPGHRIEDTRVGQDVARLVIGDDGFLAGDRVLVAGYIQQTNEDGSQGWGWPPNYRAFEWKRVAEVLDRNTLRFEDPFRFEYLESWPDLLHTFNNLPYGAPRIWRCRLDDGRHTNRSLTIRNATFIRGRNRAPGTFTPISGRGWDFRLEHCTAAAGTLLWPSEARRSDYIDCQLWCQQVELDKIAECVRFDRCDIRNRLSSGGAGAIEVSFRDCNFYGFVQATPRRSWRFEGACNLYGGVHLTPGLTNTPFALTGMAGPV
jgi:hypothetical protein